MEKLRLGLIGFGARGMDLLKNILLPLSENKVDICGVCDRYSDRTQAAVKEIMKTSGKRPAAMEDYREILVMDIDAVVILSSWESHIAIAVEAMEAGKDVGMEVGGAYAVADCWKLVRTAEKTGKQCMLLENCCYGERELMVLNMVRQGLFGEIVACSGGYHHDLRQEIAYGEENRHYRLRNYLHRNCENYPTHELGPIAKILHIHHGNRMLSLTSVASTAKGLRQYAVDTKGAADTLATAPIAQGDIVKTEIKCAGGELISLTLDTTLPRTYSRGFTVRGTKGAYFEDTDMVFLDGKDNENEFSPQKLWGNAGQYAEQYRHPLWRHYTARGGHGGMDWLVFNAFVDALRENARTPLDVYDTAALMCITPLSEQSIAAGGAVQAIPDFTGGAWMTRGEEPF